MRQNKYHNDFESQPNEWVVIVSTILFLATVFGIVLSEVI